MRSLVMLGLACHALCSLTLATAAETGTAEQRWKYQEEIDDISNMRVRTVAVVGDNSKAVLVLRAEEGKQPTLSLVPGLVMFPDKTDVKTKTMGVQITMRSTAMDKPISGMWKMPWMDYKAAAVPCSCEAAKNKVFAGESVSFQFDTAGGRLKFATKGKGLEGLQDAVAKVVEIAAPDKPADAK